MAMLQFGGVMCNAVARFAPRTIWRINKQQLLNLSSSAAANPEVAIIPNKTEDVQKPNPIPQDDKIKGKPQKTGLVSAAFAALLNKGETSESTAVTRPSLNVEIRAAKTINELLTITEGREISRHHALHIVSILSSWTNKKKVAMQDFDKDPRFLQLCKELAGKPDEMLQKYRDHNHGDLATILGLTGDDEAAKLISTLSLDQMIKVISVLAGKRRRSTPILRSLSFNLSRCTQKLNIKQAGDLLYAMAMLNFPDELLLERVSSDLMKCIPRNEGHAVIGSIVTSLGYLRYKNSELLDMLCEWSIAQERPLRPQYATSLLLTLATVAHIPANASALQKTLIEPMKEADLPGSEMWLDFVWASVILGLVDPVKVSSVLDSVFIKKLSDSQCFTLPRKIKLLQVNAAAKLLIPNYKGPFLPDNSELSQMTIERSKEKQSFVLSIQDTLSNLFSSATCLKSNVNTGMGFILDVECYIDAKCNPLPIDQVAEKYKDATRLGIVALNYGDFCRGKDDPLGIYSLITKLLEAAGYRVVLIPYTEYDTKQRLVTRVKYIEERIKSTVKSPRSDT